MECLFFYLLIYFTNAQYKQNCSFNKLIRFFYQRISSTIHMQHSILTPFSYIFVLEAVRYGWRLPLRQSINTEKMTSKSERCMFILVCILMMNKTNGRAFKKCKHLDTCYVRHEVLRCESLVTDDLPHLARCIHKLHPSIM